MQRDVQSEKRKRKTRHAIFLFSGLTPEKFFIENQRATRN
jgi:hypothetical protein